MPVSYTHLEEYVVYSCAFVIVQLVLLWTHASACLQGSAPVSYTHLDVYKRQGFQIVKSTEQDAWEDAVAEAKDKAENEQHVNFIYPDTAPFQEAMAPLHDSVLAANSELQPIYDLIQQRCV